MLALSVVTTKPTKQNQPKMKAKNDPRHLKRVEIMQSLFSQSFRDNPKTGVGNTLEAEIIKNLKPIDTLIKKSAPAWPIEQISQVDLAILRLATWELLYKDKKEPYKAVVDEAVEIAKEYGSESSPGFVNGVLGSIIKSKRKAIDRL